MATWEYEDRYFRPYAASDSQAVEALYQATPTSTSTKYRMNNYTYTLDFVNMTQCNDSTGVVRRIQRIPPPSTTTPSSSNSTTTPTSLLTTSSSNIPIKKTKTLQQLIQEQTYADPYVVWRYFDHNQEQFADYPPRDSNILEHLYQTQPLGSGISVPLSTGDYNVNFSAMTIVQKQTDPSSTSTTTTTTSSSSWFSFFTLGRASSGSSSKTPSPATSASTFLQRHVANLDGTHGVTFKAQYPMQLKLEKVIYDIIATLPTSAPFQPVSIKTLDPILFKAESALKSSPLWAIPLAVRQDNCPICISPLLDDDDDGNDGSNSHNTHPNTTTTTTTTTDPIKSADTGVIVLSCGHGFHIDCLEEHFTTRGDCPSCRLPVRMSPGPSPSGTMTISYDSSLKCSGFSRGTIMCQFSLQGGSNSNGYYGGDSRHHYMPATPESFQLLPLLAKAFMQRLLFDVGHSFARNQDNVIIYGPVHLKTNTDQPEHGYPDPHYHITMRDELNSVGIF